MREAVEIVLEKRASIATVKVALTQGEWLLANEDMQRLTRIALDLQNDCSTACVVVRIARTPRIAENESSGSPDGPNSVDHSIPSTDCECLCAAWRAVPQVTIAAIEGSSVGAIAALTLSCDWRVMAESAYLKPSVETAGVAIDSSLIPQLVGTVGHSKALQYLVLRDHLTAECALDAGLVDWISPHGLAAAMATDLAKKVTVRPVSEVLRLKREVQAQRGYL